MRLAFALTLFALPAMADTITAPSDVDQVTLYNWGATVSRTVDFDAPAGVHQIIVPDLPAATSADTLRVSGTNGLVIGAVSLSTDRLPATIEVTPPEVLAAEAEIDRLEAILRDRDTAIAGVRLRSDEDGELGGFAAEVVESPVVVVEPAPSEPGILRGALLGGAVMGLIGQTVIYDYGPAVDIRNGVDALRLSLDTLGLTPTVRATAVPSRDSVAYLVAEFENTTGETILPGTAQLFLDGALTGSAEVPLVASGDTAELGFGPLDALVLTRTVPNREEGEGGIITASNQINEDAVLTIENLTGRDWPLRVLDQVPYSEQTDLEITYAADPPATITDLDDKRGVLAWDMQIGIGETVKIRLQTSLDWPVDFYLQ